MHVLLSFMKQYRETHLWKSGKSPFQIPESNKHCFIAFFPLSLQKENP